MNLIKLITSITLLDWVGYVATVLCIVSLMMSDIKKLRWLNLIASAIFAVYSVIMATYPVALTNGIIVIIDIYYLVKIYQDEKKAKLQTKEETKEKVAV